MINTTNKDYAVFFKNALNEEIDEIKKNNHKIFIFNGVLIKTESDIYLYRFDTEYELETADGSPCILHIGINKFNASIISCDSLHIDISLREKLPIDLGKITLETGSIVLMENLIKRIDTNLGKENILSNKLLSNRFDEIDYIVPADFDKLNEKQIIAVKGSLKYNISYIWGPPGTGKTSVISRIINELQKNGKTVLITSHTNSAVDTALKKSFDKFKKDNANDEKAVFLRFGETTSDLKNDDRYNQLTFEYHKRIIGKQLYERKTKLENEISILKISIDEIDLYLKKDIDEIEDLYTKYITFINCLENDKKTINNISIKVNDLLKKNSEINYKDYVNKIIHNYENITANNELLNKLEKENEVLNTEANKFIIYEELNNKLKSFGNLNQIKINLEAINKDIFLQNNNLKSIKEKNELIESEINAYNKSGTIKKLLLGSKYADSRQKQIENNLNLEDQIKSKLNANIKSKEFFEKQINEINLLTSDINALELKNSKEYWINEIKTLEKNIVEINKSNDINNDEINSIHEKIKANIEKSDIFKYDEFSNEINELFKNYYSTKLNYDYVQYKLNNISNSCDYDFCSSKDLKNRIEMLISKRQYLKEYFFGVSDAEIIKSLNTKNDEYSKLKHEIIEIDEELLKLDSQILKNAQVVGTTLTKTYLSDEIQEREFDTVIIDEASMAQIPAIWCSAFLATTNIILVGDFLQISPIVISKSDIALKWLGNSIYKHNQIDKILNTPEKRSSLKNFFKLNDQYRMEKDIADLSNINYLQYDDEGLITNNSKERENEYSLFKKEFVYNEKSWTLVDKPIKIINTKNLNAWSSINANKSKLNFYNATLVIQMAFDLLDRILNESNIEETLVLSEPRIMIITPYKAQVKLIRKIIDSESFKIGIDYFKYISVGTIHSFQGKQSDIVVFDLTVDNPDHSNKFISSNLNDDTMRECNVATTRAKFSLYIVCNLDYFNKIGKSTYISKYIKQAQNEAQIYNAEELYPKLKYFEKNLNILPSEVNNMIVTSGADYYKFLYNDLRNSKNRVIIYSAFLSKNRVSDMLPEIDNVIERGVKITLVTKSIESVPNPAITKECESILTKHKVRIEHKGNMHEKLVFIDDSIIWCGSLNTLSYSDQTGELMTRIDDKSVFDVYANAIELDKITNLEKIKKCPACNNELLSYTGKYGVFYQCKNCDYTINDNSLKIVNGLPICSKCNLVMKYEIEKCRWICDNKHWKKISKNELKIKSVISQIPEKELNNVILKYGIDVNEIWPNYINKSDVSSLKNNSMESCNIPSSRVIPDQEKKDNTFSVNKSNLLKKSIICNVVKDSEDNLIDYLNNNNIEYIDKRNKGGNLWIKGGKEIENYIKEIKNKFGIIFRFKPDGGKNVYKGQPAWWSK